VEESTIGGVATGCVNCGAKLERDSMKHVLPRNLPERFGFVPGQPVAVPPPPDPPWPRRASE
jgi:hypothetical protein